MTPRYIFRLIEAFLKRFKAIIFLGFVSGIIVFLFLVFLLPGLSSKKERVGLVGRVSTDNLPSEISSKISEGLTKVDETGGVAPAISKSWESVDAGKTWIFKLDENKKWQDNKKVVAKDINYEFSDALIEIIDDSTIKFNLENNFSAFPIILTKPIFKKGLLGTGDWKVKKVSLTGGYVQSIIIENKEKDTINYKFYPSEERLLLGFKLGEVDSIKNIQDFDDLKDWRTITIEEKIGYNNYVAVFLNTENEKLKEKTVRQALNYAISKEKINNRVLGPISPFSWAYNPQTKPYLKDTEKTKDLKNLSIKLTTLPNLLKTAEDIAIQWREVGINVDVEIVSTVPNDYEAFLVTVDIPKDPDQYSLWHSTQRGTNISKLNNPRIDKLLEDGRTELNQETRKKIYFDFQKFLVEEVPAIFLYHPNFYTVERK
jgi:peptide/nickel transport system substrate-binding protein